MRTLLLVGTLCLLPHLGAQTAAAEDRPHLLIETFGPDGWRARLGPTNLGSLLASDEGRQLWQPHVQPMLETWRQLAGGAAGGDEAIARLQGYGGAVRVALWLDPKGRRSEPASCIAIALGGDRRSDLATLGADLEHALYASIAGEWSELEVAGEQRKVRVGDEIQVTAPFLAGDHLLVAASADGDLGLAVRRAQALAANAAPLRPDAPALRVQLGLGALVAQEFDGGRGGQEEWMTAFGFRSLGDLTFAIASAGPRVRVELAQQFVAEERGLFAALLPATPTVPALVSAVPTDGSWTAGHFDLLKLYDVILDGLDRDVARDGKQAREYIVEELGFDPGPDMLAHMTDEVLLTLYDREDLVDRPSRLPWTIAWRLGDAVAFERGLEQLLPHFKPFFSRERTERHGDYTLHRFGNMVAYDVWLAVGSGVFAMSGGADGEEHLVDLLERCAKMPAEALPADTRPTDFDRLERYLPPGTHGYSVGSTTLVARMPMAFWLEVLQEFLPLPLPSAPRLGPDEEAERAEAMAALLRRHNLHVTRGATGWADRTWTWQLFW